MAQDYPLASCAHVLRYVHYVRTWRQRIRVRDPCTETLEPSPSAPGDRFQDLQIAAREQLVVGVVGHPPAARAVDRGQIGRASCRERGKISDLSDTQAIRDNKMTKL